MIPGIDYEKPFTNNFTCKIGIMFSVAYGEAIGGWDFIPYISAEQRYYFYKRKKSAYSNRDRYFSNFYLSLQENYFFEDNSFVIEPHARADLQSVHHIKLKR